MNISVIIPTYNRAHTLVRALDSVLAQSYPASEIIVVDDGSDDDTAAIIEQYAAIIYLKSPENRGVSHARNLGINYAGSEWIALLDSDDSWAPDKLKKQVNAAKATPEVRILHTEEIWIRKGRRVNPMNKHEKPDGWIYEASLPLCCVSPSSVLMHCSVLDHCGDFDESFPACEDYDLWLRIFSRYPVKRVEEPLVTKYGGHADQLSQQHWGMDRFRVRALIKMLDSDFLNAHDRALTVSMLRSKCAVLINGALKRDKHERAAKYQAIANHYGGTSDGLVA